MHAAQQQRPEFKLGELNLTGDGAPDEVLVKYSFQNRAHVPGAIDEKEREPDFVVDQSHARFAAANVGGGEKLGELGRHRAGRVDTGEPVLSNIPNVQAAVVRRGLVNSGYRLTDAHWYERQTKRGPVYVVVLAFSKGVNSEAAAELRRKTTEALRALANTVWGFGHVWSNPDGTATVNLINRRPDSRPEYALVVRDRKLVAQPVTQSVEESAE